MNKRMKKLLRELGPRGDDAWNMHPVSKESVQHRVDAALSALPQERTLKMKQKFLKPVLIAAVIAILGATTVLAAVNTDFLKAFFAGDTSYMDEFVQTPVQSVEDESYRFTLEQVLATKYQVLVICSVEGLTDEAVAELNAEDEYGNPLMMRQIDSIVFGPATSEGISPRGSRGPLTERDTQQKKYFAIDCDNIDRSEGDFAIRLNKMKVPQDIVVPMESNVETRELILANQPYGGATLQISPLGIILERGVEQINGLQSEGIEGLYFRMKNGEIKTFSELLKYHAGRDASKEEAYSRVKVYSWFREITPLSELKSVILNGIEYDMKNTSKMKPFTPDKTLQPFQIKAVANSDGVWGVPVEELCERLGAEMEWNGDGSSVTVKYRDSIYVITAGEHISKDGATLENRPADEKSFMDESGRLIGSHQLVQMMNITALNSSDASPDNPIIDVIP